MELRYYQRGAIDATYNYLNNRTGNPCIVIPTGGGKTPVIATFCQDVAKWGGRVLVVSHVRELIGQTVNTLSKVAPELTVGIYAAGLKSRDTENTVIVAQIHSIYQKAELLGRFDLILVDEAHLIPPDGDGMYQTFLKASMEINNRVRLVGLTATPYRLKSGSIVGNGNLLTDIVYEVGVKELIEGGYLSHITSMGGSKKVDTSGLKIEYGDYKLTDEIVNDLMDNDYLLSTVVNDIQQRAADRKSILVFAPNKTIGEHFVKRYQKITGEEAAFIDRYTPDETRSLLTDRFKGIANVVDVFGNKAGPLRVLANINILTTGFDYPELDCIVMLRPTASPGLYYQQIGRGFRTAPGKKDCLILDYVGNIMRHGPVDIITPPNYGRENTKKKPSVKECPECNAIVHVGFKECPQCGFEFPTRETTPSYSSTASGECILSGDAEPVTYQVFETNYDIHEKEREDGSISYSIKIEYRVALHIWKREWLAVESKHPFARQKFVDWWNRHVCPELQSSSIQPPTSCEEFMDYVNLGCIAEAKEITVVMEGKYPRVKDYQLKEIPTYESIQQKIREAQEEPQVNYNSYNDSYEGYGYGY